MSQQQINIEKLVEDAMNKIRAFFSARHLDTYNLLDETSIKKGLRFTLLFLKESIIFDSPAIFYDNVAWFYQSQSRSAVPETFFLDALSTLKEVLEEDQNVPEKAIAMMDHAITSLPSKVMEQDSFFDHFGVKKELCQSYLDSLLKFQELEARSVLNQALEQLGGLSEVYRKVIQPVQYEVGRLWQAGHVSVTQEHYCTEVTRKLLSGLMNPLQPVSTESPKFLGLCVEGELHSMGIQMVCDAIILGGYPAIFLGGNAPFTGLPELIRNENVILLGISVSIPYHLHEASELIQKVKSASLKRTPKIMVGGLAFNRYPDVWKKVGADIYLPDAASAFEYAQKLFDQG